jgi:predicted acylesterase/phospholipase RssA
MIGLCLSGGGFRATLFHLGTIRFLFDLRSSDQQRVLTRVSHICAVSGGSILAAHLALNWERYTKDDQRFNSAAGDIIRFVRHDVRGRIIRRWVLSWLLCGLPRMIQIALTSIHRHIHAPWLPRRLPRLFLSRIELLQSYYDELLVFKVPSQNPNPRMPGRAPIRTWLLRTIFRVTGRVPFKKTKYRPASFSDLPEYPKLYILATSMTTCEIASWSNSTVTIREDPTTRQVGVQARPVSLAVAASSAFPLMFPPAIVSHDSLVCENRLWPFTHGLSDGGIYDNIGIRRFIDSREIEQFDMIVVSDAQRKLDWNPWYGFGMLPSRTDRSIEIMMNRISTSDYESLERRFSDSDTKVVMCKLQNDVQPHKEMRIPKREFQEDIKRTRTDLDRFTLTEIDGLVKQGYLVAQQEWNKLHDDEMKKECNLYEARMAGPLGEEERAQIKAEHEARLLAIARDYPKCAFCPWSPIPEQKVRSDELESARKRRWRLFAFEDPYSWIALAVLAFYACLVCMYCIAPIRTSLNNGGGRYSIDECYVDLRARLDRAPLDEEVLIEHLGLDMESAWHNVYEVLRKARNKKITIKLLMMSDADDSLPEWAPEPVKSWHKNVGSIVKEMEHGFQNLKTIVPRDRQYEITLAKYKGVPMIHGFHIKKPFDVTYVSFCRWLEPDYKQYDWGKDRYHIIHLDAPLPSRNIADIFAGVFSANWNMEESEGRSRRVFTTLSTTGGQ